MIELDAASFLLQWAVGGLFFTWVTTRRREVGIGYGWMMRITFGRLRKAAITLSLTVDSTRFASPATAFCSCSASGRFSSEAIMPPGKAT